jgi:hypothetical protein
MNRVFVSAAPRSRRTLAALLTAALTSLVASPRVGRAADESPAPQPRQARGGNESTRRATTKPPAKGPAPGATAADSAASAPTDVEPSSGPAAEACINHHTSAQELRVSGKLLESRQEMRACAAEACPALLQHDCVTWLEQLETQIPSITFRATVDGVSRTDGTVFIDGVPHPELMGGRAVELNPGKHQLRFVLEGLAPYEEQLVSSEGERYRMVEVTLSSPTRGAPPAKTHRPVPVASYVLGGVAVVAAISGGIWGASSLSLRNELEDSCAPACSQRRVDELRFRALVTDLSWGVSVSALIGASAFFLLRPELPLAVDATWLPGGGLARLRVNAF